MFQILSSKIHRESTLRQKILTWMNSKGTSLIWFPQFWTSTISLNLINSARDQGDEGLSTSFTEARSWNIIKTTHISHPLSPQSSLGEQQNTATPSVQPYTRITLTCV